MLHLCLIRRYFQCRKGLECRLGLKRNLLKILRPFVIRGLLSCLALCLEIVLIVACLFTILFSLIFKVEKDLFTSLLLSETADSQFNCERSLINFSSENLELQFSVTIFPA